MKKSNKELSLQFKKETKVTTETPISKLKQFILNLLGIKINKHRYKLGDILVRKSSENKDEFFEIKTLAYDLELNPMYVVYDSLNKEHIPITNVNILSFKLFNGVMPGTLIVETDEE
jgi:hypothetical protein